MFVVFGMQKLIMYFNQCVVNCHKLMSLLCLHMYVSYLLTAMVSQIYIYIYIYIDIYFLFLQTTAEVPFGIRPAGMQGMQPRPVFGQRSLHIPTLFLSCKVVEEFYVVMCVCG
jgi:hypothetical protein